MLEGAKWIWLDEKLHPDLISSPCTSSDVNGTGKFCVIEAERAYRLLKTAVSLNIRICADTHYRLWVNGKYTGEGPVYSGGDCGSVQPMKNAYYTEYNVKAEPDTLILRATVRKNPVLSSESSHGRGGLILVCDITYDDGTVERVGTDGKWMIRPLPMFIESNLTDFTKVCGEWESAQETEYPAELLPSPLPPLAEEEITPKREEMFVCPVGTTAKFCADFDKIYSGYPAFCSDGGEYGIILETAETGENVLCSEKLTASGKLIYRGRNMCSVGRIFITVENKGTVPVRVYGITAHYVHYPFGDRGAFSCSDKTLEKIYGVCLHTLGICRQSLHLDSPAHCGALGYTGDYYIDYLIGYYAFDDTRLTRFDLIRTAEYLESASGIMYYTSYSLMFLMAVWDYYMYTGDIKLLCEVSSATEILLGRFNTYLGSDGVIEKAPDYMFLDNVSCDGFNLSHPPKALGQATLTAFYYRALRIGSLIFATLDDKKNGLLYAKRADNLRVAFNNMFYDKDARLYRAGLGTSDKVSPGTCLPQNVNKKYFIRHPNILSVLFGLCRPEEAKGIAERLVCDDDLGDIQPYFMHFMLDMLYKVGLFGKYGIPLIRKWSVMTDVCDKGLSEGWGDFRGDFSHARGGAPAYHLPRAFSGLKMIKPGFEEISLSPDLFGLDKADIAVPTPYGNIIIKLEKDKEPDISAPARIKYTVV